MRVAIDRDGERVTVEVADDLARVTIGDRSVPVTIVGRTAQRVELEIAGEKVTVDAWPDRYPVPPSAIEVDGERWTVSIEFPEPPATSPGARGGLPASSAPAPPIPIPSPGTTAPVAGVPVVPPMPGRVVELRVRDGETVRRGQVLLVLEAMKMRNEIPSPADGVVRSLAVAPGTNARAREPMLVIAPD